jgi:hypothetical protein
MPNIVQTTVAEFEAQTPISNSIKFNQMNNNFFYYYSYLRHMVINDDNNRNSTNGS